MSPFGIVCLAGSINVLALVRQKKPIKKVIFACLAFGLICQFIEDSTTGKNSDVDGIGTMMALLFLLSMILTRGVALAGLMNESLAPAQTTPTASWGPTNSTQPREV